MCNNNCEQEKDKSILPALILILAAVSFVAGIVAGIVGEKKFRKLCKKFRKCDDDFDADEYVRSLNFDIDEE